MRTPYNWTAIPAAGGRITVYGYEDRKGQEPSTVRLPGVDKIVPAGDGTCRAHVKDGSQVILAA